MEDEMTFARAAAAAILFAGLSGAALAAPAQPTHPGVAGDDLRVEVKGPKHKFKGGKHAFKHGGWNRGRHLGWYKQRGPRYARPAYGYRSYGYGPRYGYGY
jgi:hypothetical protein